MKKSQTQRVAEQATGCAGAGDYAKWAKSKGWTRCEVYDWTSSAGDWQFLVSKDGNEWYMMYQTNNYPRGPGFTRFVNEEDCWYGTLEEVSQAIWDGLPGVEPQ